MLKMVEIGLGFRLKVEDVESVKICKFASPNGAKYFSPG